MSLTTCYAGMGNAPQVTGMQSTPFSINFMLIPDDDDITNFADERAERVSRMNSWQRMLSSEGEILIDLR